MDTKTNSKVQDSAPRAQDPRPGSRGSLLSQPLAWLVLVICLLASVGGWVISRMHTDLSARKQFDEETSRIKSALTERMLIYQDVLHGAVGLYAASYSVERAEFHAYIESVSVDKRFPGVDGVGFIERVARTNLQEFIRRTRDDRFPGFDVTSTNPAAELFVVKYAEPEHRHRNLLGRDIAEDGQRRLVAERARTSGNAAISGRLRLLGDGGEVREGFIMLMPVYRNGAPVDTLEEREAAAVGWVFARFITDELMRTVLESTYPDISVELFEGVAADLSSRVYVSDPDPGQNPDYQSRFSETMPFALGGRNWTLRFTTGPVFESRFSSLFSLLVGLGGALASFLLFGISWTLSRTRQRAVAIAADMTSVIRDTNERLQKEISERRRAEGNIRDSEALYHSLVESLPLNIYRKDLQGRFTFANQRFCNDVGKSMKEILGRKDGQVFAQELAERHEAEDGKVLETGVLLESVEQRPTADGTLRHMQVIRTPVYDGEGSIIGVQGIYWDVTDKRLAEEELEHERFLLRTLMDNLPERIYFKDVRSRFLRNSRAHLQRFGLTHPSQAIGKTDFDFFTEEHAREAYEDEQELMRSGTSITKEERETWHDGSVTWALSTKMPLRDERGQVIGTFGISHDITERKRAEEAMRQAKEAAEEANRTKSQFLASMSHELRTPLNSVIGFANILLKNKSGNLTANELNFLNRILANGKHLLGLINQILDLSKIEARRIEVQMAPVALDELVRETLAQHESLVRDQPVQLLAEVPPDLRPIQTDADKLRQILINLIGNALKFTESGSVTVRVRCDARKCPVQIDVVDTGIGIPRDKLKVIFAAFQQADASTSRKYGGTGLGLTISQALCQVLGYRIVASSETGKGSTFSVMLSEPATVITDSFETQTELALPPTVANTRSRGQDSGLKRQDFLAGRTVLVIDDEADARALLTLLLEESGCRVLTAASGTEGLKLARQFKPDLITTDLLMPEVDGWQVVRSVRNDPQLGDIPVVVISVVAGENRGRIIGAVDVIEKPVNRTELMHALRRNLPELESDLHSPQPITRLSTPDSRQSLPNARILLVEDDADARRIVGGYLEGEAAELRYACSGPEALALLQGFVPDLILLDLMMPGMDGFAFLSTLRSIPRFRRLPVVVITAKELSREELRQLESETIEVLHKADDFEVRLRQHLRELIESKVQA